MADEIYTTDADGVWSMDVDTFAPRPEGHVTVKKVKYPIFSFLDIPIEASLKVARLGEDIANAPSFQERMDRSIEQILLLNEPGEPRLTAEMFKSFRPKQLIHLTVLATSIAKVPLKADPEKSAGDGGSPSPSPASADSTAGSPARSSD